MHDFTHSLKVETQRLIYVFSFVSTRTISLSTNSCSEEARGCSGGYTKNSLLWTWKVLVDVIMCGCVCEKFRRDCRFKTGAAGVALSRNVTK